MAHSSEDIRNVALLGHGNTGKSAFVDSMALRTKVSSRRGDSSDGSSFGNSDPEEIERKHTLSSHVFSFPLDKIVLNVIDTPGHADFVADALAAMQVVETGLMFVSASSGLSFHTRRLWSAAGKAGLGRVIILTHVDAENSDFDRVLADINELLGDQVVPITYPDSSGPQFSAVHDVLKGEGPRATEFREKLEERVAEADDTVLESYLENGSIDEADLTKHFTAAMVLGKVVPLFVVAPQHDLGVDPLCAAMAALLPSPVGFGPRNAAAADSDSYEHLVDPSSDGPFASKVFKVVVDPYVGRISYLRCFRGSLETDGSALNVRSGDIVKLHGLLGIKGKDTEPVNRVGVGDLFAVAKLEGLSLDDSLTAESEPRKFLTADYPLPTYSLAVTPKSRGDEGKINEGLEKLAAEDPTFAVGRDAETAELIITGMSPLQLEVHLARLLRRYHVSTENHKPKIPYRETVTVAAEGHHRHKKQSGGRGQFAEVYMRIRPREHGAGFEFVDKIVGGSIPRQFIPEVEKGIRRFLTKGALAGCPVVDVTAEIYDGKFHDVDSDQISFQLAGERGFLDAFNRAKPILLEPVMDVEIHVPERFTGDVAGNLSSLRGRMSGMEMVDGIQVIKAQVPLVEMQDYSAQLRSITAGEGTFSMTPATYEQVPANLQQEIVANFRRAQEAK